MKSLPKFSSGLGGLAASLICLATVHASEETRPNILFAIADDWSYGHAGAYGSEWVRTPAFDRVAQEGMLFNRAYTPNAKCAPSRAIILTGRNSWQLKEAANHWSYFPIEFKTYVEALGEHGYFAGMTAKGWAPGIALDAEGEPRLLAGRPFNEKTAEPPARFISKTDYAANFEEFLAAAPEGQPWAFWYGGREPHRPYEFGSGVAKGGKQLSDIDRVPAYWPDNDTVRNDMLDYAFAVEHFDNHLGRMLDLLEERGLLDNTIVVVTSDHGMPFPRVKGQAYADSNHVPLAIMWKRGIRKSGRVVDDHVSLADLAPTFIGAAGVEWEETGMQPHAGRALSDLFDSTASGQINPERDHVMIGKERHDIGRPNDWGYPIRGIVKDDLLYIHNFEIGRWPSGNPETGYLNCDGGPTKSAILEARRENADDLHWALNFGKRPAEELFHLAQDPDCVNNLALNPDFQAKKEALRDQLFEQLEAQGDPRMFQQGHLFDEYPYANKRHLNFHERYLDGEKLRAGWVNESDFEKAPLD